MENHVITVARALHVPQVSLSGEEFHGEIKEYVSHAADPIKSLSDIALISDYLKKKGKFRDNLLFVMGTNFGLRCGDLTSLQVAHMVFPDGNLREQVVFVEAKTRNTSSTPKKRVLYVNEAVMDALMLYLGGRTVDLNEYLFASRSNNNCQKYYNTLASKVTVSGKPYCVKGAPGRGITPHSVSCILKNIINKELGIQAHSSSHCLRKTFAYHVIQQAEDRSRAIEKLQRIFGHANQQTTLHYAGITADEVRNTYLRLNLGDTQDRVGGIVSYLDFAHCCGLRRSAMA